MNSNAINGFVWAEMQISTVFRNLPFAHRFDGAQTVNSDFGINNIGVAVFMCFFYCTARPVASVNVVSGSFVTQNIERNARELSATTTVTE
ncbi:hypothetical protein D3C75_742710 [compost metagenome]